MRSSPKALMLKVGIIVVAICVGAPAIHAWQAQAIKAGDKPAAGSMSTFIRDIHSAYLDGLPVQVIEDYN